MQNISELIGIIKGIDFDGVIKDSEVLRLQSWVNKNRDLTYESGQIEFIKLVNTILKDQIIDDDEKDIMLTYCETFLKGMPEDITKIYELNGIIEGIICDGEVNELEVYRLREWLKLNDEVVRGYKNSAKLMDKLDDIVEDGIVTEDEQEVLLQMLSSKISSSQFETRLEYLKKQVRAKKNIGMDLIELLDDEDVIDEIHMRAEAQLMNALNSYSGTYVSDQEIVFISLVLIAMIYYNGNYYENVRAIYKRLYRDYTEQKVEGLIRSILNRYSSSDMDRTIRFRIINVALSNTIVPSPFLKSFFEFIYDIYKLNFEYNLSDDLAEDFRFVFEGLRTSMMSDSDELKLNVTKKTYKLIKSTKQIIVNEKYVDAVIKLSILVVKLIDKKIWNNEEKIFNPYLKQGYEEWASSLKYEKDSSHYRKKSEFLSRWEPKYILWENEIFIVPPIHRLKTQYDYTDIRIIVTNGNEEIYVNTLPDIREIIGGYQVSVDKIKIDNPIGNIAYKVMAGNEVIYHSKEKLYRKYLVFDIDGSEIQNNTDYSGTAIFCISNEEKKLKTYYRGEKYVLSIENVKLGSTYILGETVFNFSSLVKPGIFGDMWNNYNIIDKLTKNQFSVYKNVKFLVFEADVKSSSFEVVLDGKSKRLKDMNYTTTERKGIMKYVLNLNVLEDGIHIIEVNSWNAGKKNKVLSPLTFALDSKLITESVKIDDKQYMIEVKSALFSPPIIEGFYLSKFDENLVSFEVKGKEYSYQIPFNFEIYRINNQSWVPINEAMWIGDIRNDSFLDIYGMDIDQLQIYSNTGEIIECIFKIKNRGVYKKIPIGFLLSYKVNYDYVVLSFLKDGNKQKEITCYNKCIVDEKNTAIKYDTRLNCLDVTSVYFGKGNVFFTIIDKRGHEIYRSTYLEPGKTDSVYNLKSFENYTVSFFEKEKGLSLKKDRLMKTYETIFYAREDFIGRSFKIKEVEFNQLVKGNFLRKQRYFNTTYVYFDEQDEENRDLFNGQVYVRTYNGTFTLDNVNPVKIEICSDVIDDEIELAITNDGDGLLLDFYHNGIMNTMDDDRAVDIFSYIIDVNGVRGI